ncbi:MAG: Hsp70 family protein, partial [Pseudomonadota bacterium]
LQVTALDRTTGREQSITVQGASNLSEADIQQAIKDAEKFADEDKKRREGAEARNQADSLVHATEKQLEEHGDKVDADTKEAVQTAIDEAKEALSGDDADAINAKAQALTEAAMKMGQQIYEAEQAAGPSAEDAPSENSAADDDVVDAEFSEVDEDKKG